MLCLFAIKSQFASSTGLTQQRITQLQDGSLILALDNSKTIEMETVPSPVITDQNIVLGEIFPVPARLKATLSEDVIQRFEWKYYLRREGKGKNRQITQVGRKMKVRKLLYHMRHFIIKKKIQMYSFQVILHFEASFCVTQMLFNLKNFYCIPVIKGRNFILTDRYKKMSHSNLYSTYIPTNQVKDLIFF